ncbi:SH3 domain-containing protein [Ruminiclostridium herbifermentans]|uniref:SH3 domain-containing protein n=1 Tax=Ruminiclostridium herbifermentans TaxID=2488810 RepID=A0A7H1VPG3_9FIRM|nr:SH3 domain-containing protein [Ruminiclostridium herbifermentans]QNU67275.1 SH3 domain-containing protein [Ruminiclostridium herbifermentans]
MFIKKIRTALIASILGLSLILGQGIACAQTWVLTVNTDGSNLNVRSGPGTNYSIIGKFANGTDVTWEDDDGKSSGDWAYVTGVSTNGKTISGYCYQWYLIHEN